MDFLPGKRNPIHKIIPDYEALAQLVKGLRAIKSRIVLTVGSWDLLHIGHIRYLLKAKEYGDALIVGVDTDQAVKLYKGDLRPIVPQGERCEMLSYQTCVDFVTILDDVNSEGRWSYGLLKKIQPDVFVAVEDSYPEEQLKEIGKYCGKLVVLPRQAENTSTSKMIQHTVKKHLEKIYDLMERKSA